MARSTWMASGSRVNLPWRKTKPMLFRAIAEMELRAIIFDEAGGFQRGQNAHLAKNLMIVGQQGFADMKAGKMFLFQHQHAFSGAGKIGGGGAAAGAATNDHSVVSRLSIPIGIIASSA